MILDKVNTPDDLKSIIHPEMETLADEMREIIIKKLIKQADTLVQT